MSVFYQYRCIICNGKMNETEKEYSLSVWNAPICNKGCQNRVKQDTARCTPQAVKLLFALLRRGVPAEYEKYDGHKHIDIAITDAKINIEVDGLHHSYNSKQALTDLLRTTYSHNSNFQTIRIPNSLINDYETLEETADILTHYINQACYNRMNNNRY